MVFDDSLVLEKTINKEYDLIILDLLMPVLGGVETIELIKKQFKSPPKIIALTAPEWNHDKKELKKKGFLDVYRKPLTSQLCENIVSKWLDQTMF